MNFQPDQVLGTNQVDPNIINVDDDTEVVFVSEVRRNPRINARIAQQQNYASFNQQSRGHPRNEAADAGVEVIVVDDDTPSPPKPPTANENNATVTREKNGNSTSNDTSKSPRPGDFTCGICFDEFPHGDGLSLGECDDVYCEECMVTYLQGVATEKKYPVKCPGCKNELNPWLCASALESHDKGASEKLQQLAVEKMAIGGVKYCSNKKCNTPFEFAGGEQARVDCPLCHVSTCAECGLSWHEGRTCAQAKGATEMAKLAKENNWRHCPSCSELIERIDGCNFVRCKCGTGFCFNCGKPYEKVGSGGRRRGGFRNGHGTPGCQCGLFQNMPRPRPQPHLRGLAPVDGNAMRRRNLELRNRLENRRARRMNRAMNVNDLIMDHEIAHQNQAGFGAMGINRMFVPANEMNGAGGARANQGFLPADRVQAVAAAAAAARAAALAGEMEINQGFMPMNRFDAPNGFNVAAAGGPVNQRGAPINGLNVGGRRENRSAAPIMNGMNIGERRAVNQGVVAGNGMNMGGHGINQGRRNAGGAGRMNQEIVPMAPMQGMNAQDVHGNQGAAPLFAPFVHGAQQQGILNDLEMVVAELLLAQNELERELNL